MHGAKVKAILLLYPPAQDTYFLSATSASASDKQSNPKNEAIYLSEISEQVLYTAPC